MAEQKKPRDRLSATFNAIAAIGLVSAIAGGAAIDWRWSAVLGGMLLSVVGALAAMNAESKGAGK